MLTVHPWMKYHIIVLQKTPPSLECPPCSLQEFDGPCALHQPSVELAAGSRGRAKSTMLTVHPWMTFLRLCSGSPVSLGFPTCVVRYWRESPTADLTFIGMLTSSSTDRHGCIPRINGTLISGVNIGLPRF